LNEMNFLGERIKPSMYFLLKHTGFYTEFATGIKF